MTPEMKAKELVEKFKPYADRGLEDNDSNELTSAKQCALICVDEILASEQTAYPHQKIETGQVFKDYWLSVKSEIELL